MLSATVSRPPSTNSLATRLCLTLPVLLCVTLLPAQSRKKDDASWRKDPYTQDKEELMQAAGYISKGPFPWGDKHDSAQIEHVLGKVCRYDWKQRATKSSMIAAISDLVGNQDEDQLRNVLRSQS